VGNEGIKSGEDYFYQRLRVGIAYYYLGNYRKATNHLEKALSYNSGDAITLEYLYYSYLYSKRDLEARALTIKFSQNLNEKLNTNDIKIVDQIYIETGPTLISESQSFCKYN